VYAIIARRRNLPACEQNLYEILTGGFVRFVPNSGVSRMNDLYYLLAVAALYAATHALALAVSRNAPSDQTIVGDKTK
jgi:hypothetical protein